MAAGVYGYRSPNTQKLIEDWVVEFTRRNGSESERATLKLVGPKKFAAHLLDNPNSETYQAMSQLVNGNFA